MKFFSLRGLFLLLSVLAVGACATQPPASRDAAAHSRPTAGRDEPPLLRVSAVGDIMLGGSAQPELARLGYDYPFAFVSTLFRDAHIVFGNLEGPLTDGGEPEQDKQYVFRSPPALVVPALKAAGFNVVSLANNHMLDYGAEGLRHTQAALAAAGIAHAGAGEDVRAARRPVLIEANGFTVAVLAYSLTLPEHFFATGDRPGTAFGNEDHVRQDVAAAREQADLVLVSFHWGQEGKTELREYQTRVGRAAIEAGAAAVLGHHPHILQGVERYRDGVILYSLGNFVFGSYSKTARRSVVAQLAFARGADGKAALARLELVPLNVDNVELNFRPQPLCGEQADEVIAELARLSAPFNTVIENRDGVGALRLAAP